MSDADGTLLLAGTRAAVAVADALDVPALRLGPGLPVPRRDVPGPFDDALARGWAQIISAAHPFDAASGARATLLQPRARVIHYRRPGWTPDTSWHWASDVVGAVAAMPPGLRVFAVTGRTSEADLARYKGAVLLRQTRLHNEAASAPQIRYHFAQDGFDMASERALFERLGVEALLARDLGGRRGAGKVRAAEALGLPIYMVARPALDGSIAEDEAALRAWMAEGRG